MSIYMHIQTSSLNVGIIGCGWLGTALAMELLKNKANVVASTTSVEKQSLLKELGINTELLTLPCDLSMLTKLKIFQQQQLVICIPPQLKQGKTNYQEKIALLLKAAEQGCIKRVILISTTAVYRGLTGIITELSVPDSRNEKVRCLVKAEQLVQHFMGEKAIIRFAGLVGTDRHPGRFLAGKTGLTDANTSVNLIHQHDAVAIIIALLSQPKLTGIFNGVSNTKATRQQFYQQAAKKLNLTPPEFINEPRATKLDKVINSDKIQHKLGYQLVYADLFSYLND